MNYIETLIISDKFDYTTDFVCIELEKLNSLYLRLNRDEFENYLVNWSIDPLQLDIRVNNINYRIQNDTLKSVYYRAPVYLRNTYNNEPFNLMLKEQWMSFIKNLVVFDKALWINNPVNTYKAENKILQLHSAQTLGFNIPDTTISNYAPKLINELYIVKSIETAFASLKTKEGFVYSNIVEKNKIEQANLKQAPLIIQEYINPKLDIRVTIIGDKVFAVSITKDLKWIARDWRLENEKVEYQLIQLPDNIKRICIKLVQELNLSFGAIDLLKTSDENYFFLEINPTGEWAWLKHLLNIPIDEELAKLLKKGIQ